MTKTSPTEADVQRAIVEALIWDGWLILRVNQGGWKKEREVYCPRCKAIVTEGGKGYVRFAYWQALGTDQQDSGISDVIAVKAWGGMMGGEVMVLAIEVKAPGRKAKVTHAQSHFLAAIESHGGIAIIADSLDDVAPYLDKVQVE